MLTMIEKKITIKNKLGLHARAAAKLVSHAARYASEIELIKDTHRVNGKSIMGVMMLAASQGTELQLTFVGADEKEMSTDIEDLFNNLFGEDE